MTSLDIAHERLINQRLVGIPFEQPIDVVNGLVAVQAQDYAGAKWALGLRLKDTHDADIDRAFNAGDILRTHVLRPTWHFVTPRDIRFLLALTAPRVRLRMAYYDRRLELDRATFARSRRAVERALRDRQWKTRSELGAVLGRAGLAAHGQRLGHLMMDAELEGLICSGPRRGNQFTYALLEERAPREKTRLRDEALAELARRYFQSHGPATVRDFVWWSGLAPRDARAGLAAVKTALQSETFGETTCFFAPTEGRATAVDGRARLLPNYDEYLVAYRDRDPQVLPYSHTAVSRADGAYVHSLILGGQLAGAWRRSQKGRDILVEVRPYARFSRDEERALRAQVERYGRFLELKTSLEIRKP